MARDRFIRRSLNNTLRADGDEQLSEQDVQLLDTTLRDGERETIRRVADLGLDARVTSFARGIRADVTSRSTATRTA